ncbi:MAG: potassium transporter TrkG [Bryobacterales bacterium]
MLQSHSRLRAGHLSSRRQLGSARVVAATSGALSAGAPYLVVLDHFAVSSPGEWAIRLETLAAVGLLGCGGALLLSRHRWGRLLASAGVATAFGIHLDALMQSPALFLAGTLACGLALLGAWGGPRGFRHYSLLELHPDALMSRARGACLTALGGWLLVVLARLEAGSAVIAVAAVAFAVAGLFAAHWLWRLQRFRAVRWKRVAAAVTAILAGAAASWPHRELAMTVAALLPAAALVATTVLSRGVSTLRVESGDWWDTILNQPARLLVVTFLALCVAGTLLLSLPISSTRAAGVSPVDAAFTAVSAVCVTGLIVLDTPNDFTGFGQAAILLLIQLGGLGIMTFSTAALGLLGRRLSLRHEGAVASVLSVEGRHDLVHALRLLLTVTFAAEAIGATLLTALFFRAGDTLAEALWRGVFTSISAFCNAGFALQSDNLVGYQQNPWVLHAVGLLIILGGLSPAVVVAVPDLLRGKRVAVQIKLAVSTSLALLVGGAFAITAIEWNNTLAGLSFFDRLHNGWFQSVTLRTAGFNSIDIAAVHAPVLTLMMVWMFIGGSPGGTAGGIKTTTAALLMLAVVAAIRGRWDLIAFHRRVQTETVYKAAAIATLGLGSLLLAVVALQLTQNLPGAEAPFEAVSALATVGLSVGATARLDEVGKILIMTTMFAGRVGPLTLFLFLSGRFAKTAWEFPEERVDVG